MKIIRIFAIELLFTLLFLKRQKIIHCDLKPENILLYKGGTSRVKVIDFGSSCFEKEKLYTYIQSRFYRAPEIILDHGYGISIDMWSLGCILPELYTGIPIFPGEDEKDQFFYILEYLGMPPLEFINMSRKKELFFDENNQPFLLNNSDGSIRLPKTKTISNFLKGTSDLFQDFVKKCLQWSPKDRMTPEAALTHNWITKDMSDEVLYQHKQKIKKISKPYIFYSLHTEIGLCQIHNLNSVSSSLRPPRFHKQRSSFKSIHSQPSTKNKILYIPKTPAKRTLSKDISNNPLTTQYSISKKKQISIMFETISDEKKKKEPSEKIKNDSYLLSSESNCIN